MEELTPEQFDEWQAYNAIRPIGQHRADIRSAVQTFFLRSALLPDSDEDAKQFMPQFDGDEDEVETPDQKKLREYREASTFI